MHPVMGALPVPFASPCQSWRYQAEENGVINRTLAGWKGRHICILTRD